MKHGDGHDDISTTNNLSNDVTVLADDGAGGFAAGPSGAPGDVDPAAASVDDLNKDGHLDIIVLSGGTGTGGRIGFLMGDDSGGLLSAWVLAGAKHFGRPAIVDVDCDGYDDIVGRGSNKVFVLLN